MSDEQLTLEQRINVLKKMVIEYDQLDDNKKISNTQEYNKILEEKEACSTIIAHYKKTMNDTKAKKDTKKKKQQYENIPELLEKMNDIKKVMETDNLEINDLITYYQELCEIKGILDDHFKTKKMEIINI